MTHSKKQKWPKIIFFRTIIKKNPISGRAMVKGKMLHFVAFFVHFDKSIRPHPGPLWGAGGGVWRPQKLADIICKHCHLKAHLKPSQYMSGWRLVVKRHSIVLIRIKCTKYSQLVYQMRLIHSISYPVSKRSQIPWTSLLKLFPYKKRRSHK